MGFHYLELDELSAYTGIPVKELKKKPYVELESDIKTMKRDKFIKQNNQNAQDKEYERLVIKYFTPFQFLRRWFDEREIVLACADSGIMLRDLCSETNVEPGAKCHYSKAEYLRTSSESVKQYDSHGRELAERKMEKRDVYRIVNPYQGTKHGDVVRKLLYDRYPELEKFGFSFYGMDHTDYEIYPKNGIYVNFAAMMSGNVDAILFRNEEYCKWYNNGRYSLKGYKEAIATDEAKEMFDLIRRIGENEKAMGRTPVYTDSKGTLCMPYDTKLMQENDGVRLFMEDRDHMDSVSYRRFILDYPENTTVEKLVDTFHKMSNSRSMEIRVAHKEDYLCDHAVSVRINGEPGHCYMAMEPVTSDSAVCLVTNTFGYIRNGEANLIIRTDCPELMK